MKADLLHFKSGEKYISYIAWLIVLTVVIISGVRFPVSSLVVGDEVYYREEVVYLSKYGLYHALSQGTSIIYSSVIYLFSKIFSIDYLVGARILSVVFFLISCKLFLKCFEQFKDLGYAEKYFGLVFFATISMTWLWKGLPDMACASLLLTCFYILSIAKNYWQILFSGIVLFIGFAVKPIVIFAIPGIILFIFLKNIRKENIIGNAIKTALFVIGFTVCFIIYHIPGYQAYHRLMLEDKNHTYVADKRVENHNLWNERNIYYAAFNLHHKPTEWYVTWEEVDSFKQQHPEINLKMGYSEYVKKYFSTWAKEIANKVFLSLPSDIQQGFFFSKWTLANKLFKSFFIIRMITLILIAVIFFFQRQFIKQNLLLYAIPLSLFLGISIYLFTPLQNNWLLFCMPFFSLPVVKFLTRYINVMILFALQVGYIIITK